MTSLAMQRTGGTARKIARADWLAAAFLLLVTLAVRGIWFGDPVPDFDEQLYSFIGWRMTEGELPFVDWWDRKPFGLFAIYAMAHGLMGPGPLAYQALGAFSALGGAWLVYCLARDLVDRFSAAVAGAIYLALVAAYGSYSGQSEIFFMPLMLGMVWLLRDPQHPRFMARALLAMLLGGLALQVKYTVLPQCLLLGGWALWWRWRARPSFAGLFGDAFAFTILGVLPTVCVALGYAAIGHFDEWLFANVTSFFERLPAPQGRWAPSHWLGVGPIAVLVLGGTYAAVRLQPPARRMLYVFYCLWGLASLATVLLPGTVYLYYYAAMAAPAALIALPLIDRSGPLRIAPGLFLLAICWVILALPDRYRESLDERRAADRLALAIAPHVGKNDNCLWLFDGPTALYRMTGSCVPTRFVYPDHLNNALEVRALGISQKAEVARILAARPGAIVTADAPMTMQNEAATRLVEDALARDYVPRLTVPMHGRDLTAWVRHDRAGDKPSAGFTNR